MNDLIAIPSKSAAQQLVAMTLATCVSPHTKRIYAGHLERFLISGHALNREGVALHVQKARDAGLSPSSQGSMLAAIKRLASEAYTRKLLGFEELSGIQGVSAPKLHRTRMGNWLSLDQVRQLLALPNPETHWGKRDRAILAVFLGCGFRRAEMAGLAWAQYQMRDGRMCWVDVLGKGGKRRTVPVPVWAEAAVDAWKAVSQDPPPAPVKPEEYGQSGNRTINPTLFAGGLTVEGLYDLVEAYGERLGTKLAPHDLRRTLAQLLRKAGAPLEQIQYTLGHSSIATTTIYLGSQLELERGKAAVDSITLETSASNLPAKPAA